MSTARFTIQERRFHPLCLTIKVPGAPKIPTKTRGVPLLPIASPSPVYACQNTSINLEPFPDFIDICPPVKAQPLHCVLHCANDICWHLSFYQLAIPPCRCGDEVFQRELLVLTPAARGPEITLDNMFQLALPDAWTPTAAIKIQRSDARTLMSKFKALVTRRVLSHQKLMSLVSDRWADPEDAATDIVATLFLLVAKYIDRTMRGIEVRTVTPQALRAELKFCLSTGLEDWIEDYCEEWERDVVLKRSGSDPRLILEAANFGLVGTVSELWTDCLNDIVLLFVLRDARIRTFVEEQSLWAAGLVMLLTLVAQFLTFCVYPVSRKMGSFRRIKI